MSHSLPNGGLGELRPQEIELLRLIREVYKYGNIEIQVRDGVPIDIIRTIERVRITVT